MLENNKLIKGQKNYFGDKEVPPIVETVWRRDGQCRRRRLSLLLVRRARAHAAAHRRHGRRRRRRRRHGRHVGPSQQGVVVGIALKAELLC